MTNKCTPRKAPLGLEGAQGSVWGCLPTPLAGPVLEPEAVTGNLPHRVAGRGLGCQDEVLVEVPLFVALKLHCPTDHHEDRGLARGGFIVNGLAVYHVDLELTGRQHLKKLTQGLLSRNGVAVPHQGGRAHVQAGQQPPPLVHGGVVYTFTNSSAARQAWST